MLKWSKRVLLFVAVNLLVMMTISLTSSILIQVFHLPPGLMGGLVAYCLLFGFGGALISLALSRLMAKWMMGVVVIDPQTTEPEARWLVQLVHRLAEKAGLPKMPEVGIYDSPEVNAFATGPSRSRSLVAVSSGLLRRMTHDQVEAVLGHEIGHVANGDMVTMTLIQGVINSVVMIVARLIANVVAGQSEDRSRETTRFLLVFVLDIVFSLLGSLVVNAFSRRREYRADAWGARLAGRQKMIDALKALGGSTARIDTEHPSVSSLKISGQTTRMVSLLFATHPPLEDRIRALEHMTMT